MNYSLMKAAVLLLAVLLAGCGRKATNATVAENAVVLGPQFSAKRGLLVPEDTRRSIGLKIVEVAEQKVAATLEVQLRVYRINENASHATGLVTTEQAAVLKAGQPVHVRTDDGRSVAAKVTALNGQLQKATGMVELLVEIPNASIESAVGSFLRATVTLDSGGSVVTIPRDALLQCIDGYSVYTLNGEHFVRTPVKVGAANAEFVETTDGLYAGDQVVLRPVMSLWMTELAAVKGGQACCIVPAEGK